MKTEVNATSVTQAANKILGTIDKILYYLIIGEGAEKIVINVGKKTHDSVLDYTKKGGK